MLSPHLSSYTSISIFQMLQVDKCPFFVKSMFYFHTTQHSKQMLSHHTFHQVKTEKSSYEVSFLAESFFSQCNSLSHFTRTSTAFGHQTSEVTELFHSFCPLTVIFIVLPSTVDILMILVFFMLILGISPIVLVLL